MQRRVGGKAEDHNGSIDADERHLQLLCVVYGLNFLDSIFLSIFHSTSRERARKN